MSVQRFHQLFLSFGVRQLEIKRGDRYSFSYFPIQIHVVTPHLNHLGGIVLMRDHNYVFNEK